MSDDERTEPSKMPKTRGAERVLLGEDGLSRLWRETYDSESGGPPRVEDSIAELVVSFQQHLIANGWQDPLDHYVVDDTGKPTTQTVSERVWEHGLKSEGEVQIVCLPGWQLLEITLVQRGLAFTDEWYFAKLIGLGLASLNEEGGRRTRALVNFGFYYRDLGARSGFGRKALAKIRMEQSAGREGKAAQARRLKAATNEPDWWEDARERARAMRRKNRKETLTHVAKTLAPDLGYSEKQVRKVIKPIWRENLWEPTER